MRTFRYQDKNKRYKGEKGVGNSILFDNLLIKIVLLAVSVFLLYNVVHSFSIMVQRVDILHRARIEVESLRLRNLELALLLDNIQGIEYLEIQARDRLRFSGEDEYIFVIPEAVLEGTSEDLDAILSEDRRQDSRGGFEIWKDFLLYGTRDI